MFHQRKQKITNPNESGWILFFITNISKCQFSIIYSHWKFIQFYWSNNSYIGDDFCLKIDFRVQPSHSWTMSTLIFQSNVVYYSYSLFDILSHRVNYLNVPMNHKLDTINWISWNCPKSSKRMNIFQRVNNCLLPHFHIILTIQIYQSVNLNVITLWHLFMAISLALMLSRS